MIYGEELGGGGISTKTIPPQGLNLTLKGGNGKIDCTFTGITSEWLYLGQYYRLIAKLGSAPTSPMDGVQIKDVQVGAIGDAVISASIEGLTNGVQYYVRLYVRGENGWQTSVDAVGTATPVAGIEISTLAVGDEVKLNLGGVPYNHLVVHQGNPDTTKYDASCDGAWLLIKNIYNEQILNSSSSNYANCSIVSYLNGTYYNLFDENVRIKIKQARIPYCTGTSVTSLSTMESFVFLLSLPELGSIYSSSRPVDGSVLTYFESTDYIELNEKRIAYYNGEAEWWHTRTIFGTDRSIHPISSTGSYGSSYIYDSRGIRPAFVLPSDFLLAPEPNPDGSYSPLTA